MKISVIVPVYNGEKYLEKTIKLILNQPYKDIELILVNDGSTDNSKSICEKYVKTDNRIRLINKNNGGISEARNTGLNVATGEWVSFIDQDDEISDDIYLRLNDLIDSSIDMVVAGKKMLLVDDQSNIIQESIYNYENEIVDDELKELLYLFNVNRDTRLLHLWNCLYKKSVIDNFKIKFNTNLKFGHEDSLFNFEYVTKCKKIKYVDGVVYTYSRRMATSTSLKKNKDFINDYMTYCDVSGSCLENIDKNMESMFFTYLFRLGINLFKQYGLSGQKETLSQIYRKAKETANSAQISRMCVGTTQLYFFYWICALLIKNNHTGFCRLIIKLVQKK